MKASAKKLTLTVAILGLGLMGLSAFLFRAQLLKRWFAFRIEIAAEKEKWETARRLEDGGRPGREAAEDCYLSILKAGANQAAPRTRDPSAARMKVERDQGD